MKKNRIRLWRIVFGYLTFIYINTYAVGHPTPEGDISHESGVTYRTISHAGDATHTEYRMRVTQRTQNIAYGWRNAHRISQCGWRNAHWITEYRSAGDVTRCDTSPAQCVGVTPVGWRHAPHTFFFIFLIISFFLKLQKLVNFFDVM